MSAATKLRPLLSPRDAVEVARTDMESAIGAAKEAAKSVAGLQQELAGAKAHHRSSQATLDDFKREDEKIVAAKARKLHLFLKQGREPEPEDGKLAARRGERMKLEDAVAIAEAAVSDLENRLTAARAAKAKLEGPAITAVTLWQQTAAAEIERKSDSDLAGVDAQAQELRAVVRAL